MGNSVRLKDVARLAGVGIGTASRVLNNHPNVSDEKRKKVIEAMEALNYRPNTIARSLKTQITHTIGVIIMDMTNPFYTTIIKGIEGCAYRYNYNIIVVDLGWKTNKLHGRIQELRDKKVDGIIYMGSVVNDLDMQLFVKENMPVSFISTSIQLNEHNYQNKYMAVNIDNEQAAYDAVNYLINLGYKKIGFISGREGDLNSSVPRERGFRRGMNEGKLSSIQHWEAYGDHTYEKGYRAMLEILKNKPYPEVVFVFGDRMAMGAAKAVLSRGLKIPEDIGIMGFDDLESGKYYHPSITTVRQPRYQMGVVGMESLIRLINKEVEGNTTVQLDYTIIQRESTRSSVSPR